MDLLILFHYKGHAQNLNPSRRTVWAISQGGNMMENTNWFTLPFVLIAASFTLATAQKSEDE
ncbi:hypothetical protein L0244_35890, partial [bacterium]|nr:hypothetical protein [bacterium]